MFACSINVDIVYKIKPTLQLFGISQVMWALLNAAENQTSGPGDTFYDFVLRFQNLIILQAHHCSRLPARIHWQLFLANSVRVEG